MIAFVDEYRDSYGVEFICRVLNGHLEGGFITSRGYRLAKTRPASARKLRDEELVPVMQRLHAANYGVYGYRKLWHAMQRHGYMLGRDQCLRLMRLAGIEGVRRGRTPVTTVAVKTEDTRPDLVERSFKADAPCRLWVADITYVRTHAGFCYTAFITDVFHRKIVGWATRTTLNTEALPLEALEQALAAAEEDALGELVHHSDRGSQYLSIRYNERLLDRGVAVSVGSRGDSYDNALAESVNGLYKTELIWGRASWQSASEVEWATMQWVWWWNNERLHESLGYRTPVEVEQEYYLRQASILKM